jgi:predicted lipid carrier protein YhbT
MTDPTSEFFRDLDRRGGDPALGEVDATVRFDVTIDRGAISCAVSPDRAEADCVITGDRDLFNGVLNGSTNAMAALLRGELAVSGDPELLVAVERLFPRPQSDRRSP